MEGLLAQVATRVQVVRGGQVREVPLAEIVPGDVTLLSAGRSVPGDGLLIEARDLFISEAALTGESEPAEKAPGPEPAETPLARRHGAVFLGTHVISGAARAVIVATGARTELGRVAARVATRQPETDFEHGLRRFGYLLLEVTLLLVLAIFAVNVYLARPVLESLMFSLALAIGSDAAAPPGDRGGEPGARRHAHGRGEDHRPAAGVDPEPGQHDRPLLRQDRHADRGPPHLRGRPRTPTGSRASACGGWPSSTPRTRPGTPARSTSRCVRWPSVRSIPADKRDEIPFDFTRRRLSVLLGVEGGLLITKGAVSAILAVCTTVETAAGVVPLDGRRAAVDAAFTRGCENGLRVIAVAYRRLPDVSRVARDDEREMTFAGLVRFHDAPKADAPAALAELARLGVGVKIVTGDNVAAAAGAGQGARHRERRRRHRRRASPRRRRRAACAGPRHRRVRRGGADAEGADRAGAAPLRARGRVSGRRDQRRAGAACRRRRYLRRRAPPTWRARRRTSCCSRRTCRWWRAACARGGARSPTR